MIKVAVESTHIAKGVRWSRCFCPIARALRDRFGRDCDPRVGPFNIALGTTTTYYELPEAVARFIDTFDSGGGVEPFEFELTPIAIRYR